MTKLVVTLFAISVLWVTGWLWPVVVGIFVFAAIVTADLRRAHW